MRIASSLRPFSRVLFVALLSLALSVPAHAASVLDGPDEVYVGETIYLNFLPTDWQSAYYHNTFQWSTTGGEGAVLFADPNSSDECNPYNNPVTQSFGGCSTGIAVLGTRPGTVTVQVQGNGSNQTCDVSNSGGTSPSDNATKVIKVLPRMRPPDKMPLGAKLRRVDVHGVPMADPSPTGEGEKDRIPNMAYTDMYDLSPKYAVTDLSVPVDGGELSLEFRRSMSIKSRNYNPDLAQLGITYPTEDLLGLGWDANLGARILLTLEKDKGGGNYRSAQVVDEVGNSYRYIANATFTAFAPDVTHSFNNESVKAKLTRDGAQLVLTKPHGTVSRFEFVRTYRAPFSIGAECSEPTLLHSEDYWRLKSVTDRHGNRLDFTYYTTTEGPSGDLVAHTITFVGNGQPGDTSRVLTINASHHVEYDENTAFSIPTGRDSGWRIDSVVDPLGRTTSFTCCLHHKSVRECA